MLSANLLLFVSLSYVALLFLVAFVVDRRAQRGRIGWLQSPLVYTLSISIYCTSWTFYGAVGSAARNGLEFATIYLGPTLVFVGWWWILRKLVRIGRVHRITSIADLISSRFGKSPTLAVFVTLIAVIATTPYIALQLQSVTTSFRVIIGNTEGDGLNDGVIAFWVAAGMALFTILFGTRNVTANERHHGVVAAIAVEALVKLFAFIAVGLFAIYGISGGIGDIFSRVSPELLHANDVFGSRWVALTFLSATAIICLPRQFQVTVVENVDEKHLATASWLFPLYLVLLSIFVLPIAAAGLTQMPEGSNTDMFVLTLPLSAGQEGLATFAFIGGFSSATSMVIVAAIALSTMVSNHIVMPVALKVSQADYYTSGDVRRLLLRSRRISIAGILMLGFIYFRLTGGSEGLASIGLIAFAGIAQVLPGAVGGVMWRGATRYGALAGMTAGFAAWAYMLLIPSFRAEFDFVQSLVLHGPFGIGLLRPEAFLGLTIDDPLVHALFWSIAANTALFVFVSLVTRPTPLERLQGALFVDVFRMRPGEPPRVLHRTAPVEDLFVLAQRILGAEPARLLFADIARAQGLRSGLPVADDAFVSRLERELAGSVGAASAHAMVSQVAGGGTISLTELMKIADETAQILEYSQQLTEKSAELESTARQLRVANTKLQTLSAQKDDFLSQVSHELRTPMTSIRSFSEILLETPDVNSAQAKRFLTIINEECLRLTKLLDEILDLSFLESGKVSWTLVPVDADAALERALASISVLAEKNGVQVLADARAKDVTVMADFGRLTQVFLNVLNNSVKYNTSAAPRIEVTSRRENGTYVVSIADNGPGIPDSDSEMIFSKFGRGGGRQDVGSSGLGLSISREILRKFNGDVILKPGGGPGATFEIRLPAERKTR
ncbi:sensor histidine kinase [Microbaculum marinisediminis]|uniref:histidine kinase n=1 Tax=Microbaculum marinisediminis TaxID=2931392 RepID=A0AAW5QRD4_9HYPH|nr:sensor histidine kinase [Microbaculum sp. A6E488]MCT8970530.1 sensor histidine kinase [Microbaculum sp. A6E488]